MLGCLVLKSVLVKYFILALSRGQAVHIATIHFKLIEDDRLVVVGADDLVLDVDLVDLALVNKSVVLVVSDLALFASLELLPGLLFDHSRICIEILPLQADFLQLLCQTSLFFALLFLLGLNLTMDFKKTFLFGSLCPLGEQCSGILLLSPAGVVLSLSSHASLFDLAGLLHQFGRLLLLLRLV